MTLRQEESVRRSRRSVLLIAAAVLFFLVVAGVAQDTNFVPLTPQTLAPQTIPPIYLWNVGAYGTDTVSVRGNSTAFGTTLLLNSVDSQGAARAVYGISFPDLEDLGPYAENYTLYVPGSLAFNSSSAALVVIIGSQVLTFHPTASENVPWYSNGPLYVPSPSSLVGLPLGISGGGSYTFIPFAFQSRNLSSTAPVTIAIEVPAGGQIYIPEVILSLNASTLTTEVPRVAEAVGLATLPFTIGAVVGTLYFMRRFGAGKVVGTLVAAFALRVGLAPVFMHPDVSTLIRYSHLFFNYHLVNLQTWTYGLLWYAAVVIPAAPAFALGITPTFDEWDLLLKIPAIVADLLTFLVLYRLLTPYLGQRRAYIVSVAGWLFNPLVVYTGSVHGLGESVVALFVTLAAYGFSTRKYWVGVMSVALSAITILPAALLMVPSFLSRRISWPQRVAMLLVPVAAYVVVFLGLYGSVSGLVPYAEHVVARTNQGGLVLGASTTSSMSYLFRLNTIFGIYVSPTVGLFGVLAIGVLLWVRHVELFPTHAGVTIYGALAAFYFTYEVFYVQHLVWAVPVLIVALVLAPGVITSRAVIFCAALSTLAFLLNLQGPTIADSAPVLAMVLFAWLAVPLWLWLPRTWIPQQWGDLIGSLLRGATVAAAVGVILAIAVLLPGKATLDIPAALVGAVYLVRLYWTKNSEGRMRPGSLSFRLTSTLAVGLPLFLLYLSPVDQPNPISVLILITVLAATWELARWTLLWLRSPQELSISRSSAPRLIGNPPTSVGAGTPQLGNVASKGWGPSRGSAYTDQVERRTLVGRIRKNLSPTLRGCARSTSTQRSRVRIAAIGPDVFPGKGGRCSAFAQRLASPTIGEGSSA